MTTSIYARPEFTEMTVAEIQQVMRGIYAKHRVRGLFGIVIQALIMSGFVRLYLTTCIPDIVTLLVLTAASGVLGAWLGWMCMVNVVYPRLIRKQLKG